MNRFQKWTLALGTSLFILFGGAAEAYEPYYLNGNKNLPMIGNTGGIYNDGNTGLFLNLSTLEIEDVFEDGLQAKVRVLDISSGKKTAEGWLHLRYDVEGKSWALGKDDKWREIPSDTDDPAQRAVSFIREELGNDGRRDVFSGQILKIMDKKKDKLGKAAPPESIPLESESPLPEPAVKKKGNVEKGPSPEGKDKKTGDSVSPIKEEKKETPPAEPETLPGTDGNQMPEVIVVSVDSGDSSPQPSSSDTIPVENHPEPGTKGESPEPSGNENSPGSPESPAADGQPVDYGEKNGEALPPGKPSSEALPGETGDESVPAEPSSRKNTSDVVITITEAPQVEIIKNPPSQTDITTAAE